MTKTRKATTTYTTEKGNLVEAVRLNPERRSVYGRRYGVLVNGKKVGEIVQTGRGRYTFPAMQHRDYLTEGSLSQGLLVSAAQSMVEHEKGEYL